MTFWQELARVLFGGVISLADYLSLHVLLCLIPAFFIAGAMVAFIPPEIITKYLGKDSKRIVAYPVAAIGGLLLAVCSCTVLPLFAGIKKKGAGLGPAMTFLFSAPAVNILAITYTGVLIGMDIAIARAILALTFSIIIGLLMEAIFKDRSDKGEKQSEEKNEKITQKEKEEENQTSIQLNKETPYQNRIHRIFGVFSVVAVIIIGLLIAFLTGEMLEGWGVNYSSLIQTAIWGVGVIMLIIAYTLFKHRTGNLFLGLIYILFTGTSQISYFKSEGNSEAITAWVNPIALANMGLKAALTLVVTIVLIIYTIKNFSREEGKEWMLETWDFVKKIMLYIIIGVFIAGVLQELIPPSFIQNLVGQNTVLANSIGVSFGIVAYFPTLMEVPIAKMFLNLGMSRGVLLAYLLADPELSIQSILVVNKYIGLKKNLVYVAMVAVLCILAGLLFGLIVTGEPIGWI